MATCHHKFYYFIRKNLCFLPRFCCKIDSYSLDETLKPIHWTQLVIKQCSSSIRHPQIVILIVLQNAKLPSTALTTLNSLSFANSKHIASTKMEMEMETILSTIQLCSNIYMIYICVCVCLYLYIYFFCVYFTHHMVTHNRWHPLTPSICQPLAPLRFQPINSTFRHFSFSILHDYFLFLFDICISFCLWLVSLVGYKSIW